MVIIDRHVSNMSHFRNILSFCLSVCILVSCARVCSTTSAKEFQTIPRDKVYMDRFSGEPSVIYLEAYRNIKESERTHDTNERIQYLQRALCGFESVQRIYHDWKKNMVIGRISDTKSRLDMANNLARSDNHVNSQMAITGIHMIQTHLSRKSTVQ